jgi:hypothetical protein
MLQALIPGATALLRRTKLLQIAPLEQAMTGSLEFPDDITYLLIKTAGAAAKADVEWLEQQTIFLTDMAIHLHTTDF